MKISNTDRIYLGIDGGGSTCRARLRDQNGTLLGDGESGPANLRLGLDNAGEQIQLCAKRALQQAKMSDYPLDKLYTGMGLAGAVLDDDMRATQTLRQQFAQCALSQDAYIACLGAHLGQAGGVVIIGTGSCAQIVSPERNRSYGGWGFALSDHSGGAWLGRNALSYALQTLDMLRPSSPLCEHICARFEHQSAQMLHWSDTATPAKYASFAPLVFEHADNGDAVALEMIEAGCTELQRLISVLQTHDTGRISLLGGLANSYHRYLPQCCTNSLHPARADALDGALIMAGLPISTLEKL